MKAVVDKVLSPRHVRMNVGPNWIRSLEPSEADGGYLTAAIRTVSEVAAELDIDPTTVSVTLFARCAPDHPEGVKWPRQLNGFTTPSHEGVFLSAELTAAQLLDTAAHETRHLWQNRQGWRAFHNRAFLEHDARTFGRTWALAKLQQEWRLQRPGEAVPRTFA